MSPQEAVPAAGRVQYLSILGITCFVTSNCSASYTKVCREAKIEPGIVETPSSYGNPIAIWRPHRYALDCVCFGVSLTGIVGVNR